MKLKKKKIINNAIIGHNGLIGTHLKKIIKKPTCFNSKNIKKIRYNFIKNLYIAAPSSLKFKAINNIKKDLDSVKSLVNNLEHVKARKVYLFGTIDAVNLKVNTNENLIKDLILCNSYGIFRGLLEDYCIKKFNTVVLRLPVVFNKNLKKNFLFDLKNKKYKFLPNPKSELQFYNLDNLKNDLNIIKKNKIKMIHLVSEPIKISKIYKKFLKNKSIKGSKNIIFHNLTSLNSKHWNQKNYLYYESEIFDDLKELFKN